MAQFYMRPKQMRNADRVIFAFGIKDNTAAIDPEFEAERLVGYLKEEDLGKFARSMVGSSTLYLANTALKEPEIHMSSGKISFRDRGEVRFETEVLGSIRKVPIGQLSRELERDIDELLTYSHKIYSPSKLASQKLQEAISNYRCSDTNASKWIHDLNKLDNLIRILQ